jgi:hypothetical protein
MMEDFPLETAGFDAFEFQLANGHDVKVVFARFWERLTLEDRRDGAKPMQYVAIKVYSTEDMLPRRLGMQCEFRASKDFNIKALPAVWEWLARNVEERGHVEYDGIDDFLDEFADRLYLLSDTSEDAVEHLANLPRLVVPRMFDQVDDSIFNDQNDMEEVAEQRG